MRFECLAAMLVQVVFCLLFLGTFSISHTAARRLNIGLVSAAENITNSQTLLQNQQGKEQNKKMETFPKDLFQEVESNLKPIIKESIYNESRSIQICSKNIVYVNESNGTVTPWFEFQVVFHFPDEDDDQPIDDSHKEYKQYGIYAENGKDFVAHDFEVFEKNANYTLSKNVNVTCGTGRFLAKAYYELPKADKKKLVIRLTNDYPALNYGKFDFVKFNEKNQDVDDILESPSDDDIDDSDYMEGNTYSDELKEVDKEDLKFSENKKDQAKTIKENGTNVVNKNKAQNQDNVRYFQKKTEQTKTVEQNGANLYIESGAPNQGDVLKPESNDTLGPEFFESNETSSTEDSSYDSEDDILGLTSENPMDVETTAITPINEKVLASIDLCSPFLTQLLSGNRILPGLCDLKKDERVLLQGDIVVSRKYLNTENKTEIIKPMFVIHENTEIEVAIKKAKKDILI